MFLWFSRIVCYIPISILHPTKVVGKKNLPKGKAILSCNHLSNWDIPLYYLNTSQHLKILAKKELFEKKFVGGLLKIYGGIPIDREANDIGAIKASMKVLKENKKLFIFPEGTRLKDESKVLGEIKSGMALIAIKTKSPIVPIWNLRRAKTFGRNIFYIGKPFELDEFYGVKLDEETLARANEIVVKKMLETRQEAIARFEKKKKR